MNEWTLNVTLFFHTSYFPRFPFWRFPTLQFGAEFLLCLLLVTVRAAVLIHRLQFNDGNQTTFSTLFCFRYSYLHRIVFESALFVMKTLIMCDKDKLLIVLHIVVMSKKYRWDTFSFCDLHKWEQVQHFPYYCASRERYALRERYLQFCNVSLTLCKWCYCAYKQLET